MKLKLFLIILLFMFVGFSPQKVRAQTLSAQVVSGITTTYTQNNIINTTLIPGSQNYTTSINTPQDEGYFIKLLLDSQPVINKVFEVSTRNSGIWSAWSDFKLGSTMLTSDQNGQIKIDFADWQKLASGIYEAKFRVKGTTNESNPIMVTVSEVDTAKYFPFLPGNYWILKGCHNIRQEDLASFESCNSSDIYTTRFDVEETQTVNIGYQGTNYSIVSNPLRVSNSEYTTQAGDFDYTWFISNNFDPINGKNTKWALKLVFFERSNNKLVVKNRLKTYAFLKNSTAVPYFVMNNPHDIYPIYINHFNTALTTDPLFIEGDITNKITTLYSNVGWRTAYRILNINLPQYKGRVLRIRFWEYDDNQNQGFPNSLNWNYDEWFFAENSGLIGINNKIGRGILCSTDADCRDDTITMQTPTSSVSLADFMMMTSNTFTVGVKRINDSAYEDQAQIAPGESYNIKVFDSHQKPYTGFIEVEGEYISGTGQHQPISRGVFKNSNSTPVWIDNGVGTATTGISQSTGTYAVKIRPVVLSDIRELGVNNLPWSNLMSVTLEVISTPTPTPKIVYKIGWNGMITTAFSESNLGTNCDKYVMNKGYWDSRVVGYRLPLNLPLFSGKLYIQCK